MDYIFKILKKEYKQKAVVSDKDPFKVLMATIISQRNRDESTDKVVKKLFSRISKPEDVLKLKIKEIENLVRSSGFFRQKAKNIIKICEILLKKYDGKVPNTLEKLVKLPGVGRKTANCVLVYGFNDYGICVDVHVHRISNRLGLVETKTPEQTEEKLRKNLPKKYWKVINNLFVKHGQQICKSKPKCEICPISKYCKYYKKIKLRKAPI